MKLIYKYPMPNNQTSFGFYLPEGAQFARAGMQNGLQQMWFIVNDGAKPEFRKFQLFGTGQPIPDSFKWLYTYDNGPFVLHLFEAM